MCLATGLLSPQQEICDGLFVWLKGAEVGPPNLLQVEEQEARKLSAENERIESAKTVL